MEKLFTFEKLDVVGTVYTAEGEFFVTPKKLQPVLDLAIGEAFDYFPYREDYYQALSDALGGDYVMPKLKPEPYVPGRVY